MNYLADIVQEKEQAARANALLSWAVAGDGRLSAERVGTMTRRGHERYLPSRTKDAVDVISTSDTNVALLPLGAAFLGLVDRESVLGRLAGATRIPLTAAARLQVAELVAATVAEGAVKPVSHLGFEAAGEPTKVAAQVVISAEALRAIDPATQDGIRQVLVSACAAATDVALVTVLTSGTSAGSASLSDLFALVSGGAPRTPIVIAGLDVVLAWTPGTVRDLQALGVTILTTPAAAGVVIALDGAGLLISDGGVDVATARHAELLMDDGGSPAGTTTLSLWQRNLACLRAERFLRLTVRSGAVAWASTGSPA